MRTCAVYLIALLLTATNAQAQVKSPAKAAPEPEVRYFTAIDGLMDGNADVILRELRQGKNVQSATLDVCYPVNAASDRKDRFTATLAVANGVLTGQAVSQVDKQPVSIKLMQRQNGDSFDFKGQLTIGASTVDVASSDNGDLSEKEFQDVQRTDDGILSNPKDFTEVSPEAVAVKVRADQAVEFLKALRGQNVEISPSSLGINCDALRSGATVVTLTVDPMRAASFIAAARDMPGVVMAGWTAGLIDMDRTIRFAASEWREGERVNRERLTAVLGNTLAGALQAKLDEAKWSDASGRLKLTLKRPSQTYPALGLTDQLELTVLVAPDRPIANERLMLWLSTLRVTTRDENAGAKLNFGDATVDDEEGDSRADTTLIEALAKQLKAQRWDSETSVWK